MRWMPKEPQIRMILVLLLTFKRIRLMKGRKWLKKLPKKQKDRLLLLKSRERLPS